MTMVIFLALVSVASLLKEVQGRPKVGVGATLNSIPLEDATYYASSKRLEILRAIASNRICAPAKNIIIFIGDGMGNPIVTASRIYKGQLQGNPGEETYLNFEKFPNSGVIRTYCVDRQVPDSACSATSIFTGVSGPFLTVGLDANGAAGNCPETLKNRHSYPTSIMTHAQKAGKMTGFVTTTRVTHATPAATYAHSAHRDWEGDDLKPLSAASCKDIASQLIFDEPGRSLNVILGGGMSYFLPVSAGGSRLDNKDLIDAWKKDPFKAASTKAYVTNRADLATAVKKRPDYLLGLFNVSHMKYHLDRTPADSEPDLAEMTAAAIDQLENPNGFVLMVEGGRIDHALHHNNAKRAIVDLLAFEAAIQVALKKTNMEDTLIVVSADHSHVMTINGYPLRGNPILGLGDIAPQYGLPYTTLMFTNGISYNYKNNGTHIVWRDLRNVNTYDKDFRQLSAVHRPLAETHGGEDIIAYARGPWAHLINGAHDLAYIGHLMKFAGCLGEYASTCPAKFRGTTNKDSSNADLFMSSFRGNYGNFC